MKRRKSERGQALAETALFGLLAVVMAFGLLAWIPVHRARAAVNARQVAWQTLDASWSGTRGVSYRVQVIRPSGPGQPGRCSVTYHTPSLFNGLLRLSQDGWNTTWFISRSETWKARWR